MPRRGADVSWQSGLPRRTAVVAVVATAFFIAACAAFGLRSNGATRSAVVTRVAAGFTQAASSHRHALPTKGIGVIRLGDRFAQASGYGRYAYMIVDRSEVRHVKGYRGLTLVYMSGMDIARFNTGISFEAARAHDWLLKDSSGNLIQHDGYDSVYLANVGDPAYQQAWVKAVLAFLHSSHAGGVFIDDVLADPRGWTVGQVFPAAYPDQSSWANATVSFVKAIGPALKAHGYYVLLNANGRARDTTSSDSWQYANWWRELAPFVSGFLAEYWLQNPTDVSQLRPTGAAWFEDWRGWQRLVSTAQRAGVDFFGLTYGTRDDLEAMRYGKGSFMLDWNGKGGAFIFETEDGDPYNSAWGSDLGRPLHRKVEIQPGVWQRVFERGVVLVNATAAPVSVHVRGATETIDPIDAFFLGTSHR
jgi:hypothetical protein